ncbi:MAG: DUF4255 domain-containing protein [Clostridiales Family XIII bacterium]|jgi:hypothetical protein|nr:DUF4255 domain-containing protein [Clostridiales Family XIII bacterium]
MADYSIISDVSAHIIKTLREKMCPEPLSSPNNIDVTSPAEQDVDYILGLYLYDIAEELDMSGPRMVRQSGTRLTKPSKPYALYYMLFINGSSQMGLKAHDIQKIIGRAAQVVNDGNVVNPKTLQPWLIGDESPIVITPARIPLEEKVRIWSAINKPYQVSLFYKVSPVFLSSEIVVDPPRVSQAAFNLEIE